MEIGSEFWLENKTNNIQSNFFDFKNYRLLMSGRTAIDLVLDEIQKQKKIRNVYFPDYCCSSMLQPFIDRDIKIDFYKVEFSNSKMNCFIDEDKVCDVFFAMNYFGFQSFSMDKYIDLFKSRGITVIEDITHSLLSTRNYSKNSDFVIASLRKWFPIISGGIAISNGKDFTIEIKKQVNSEFINIKRNAMKLKQKYIAGDNNIEKKDFLDKYKSSNDMLGFDYKNYAIDEESINILKSINIDAIRDSRNINAKIIYQKMKNKNIKFLNNNIEQGDCLLFVPILVDEKRENLKEYLISNNIYCPVHWQVPAQNIDNSIYKKELSLICDQRYSKSQINDYMEIINMWNEE